MSEVPMDSSALDRFYYRNTIAAFLQEDEDSILGKLARANSFDLVIDDDDRIASATFDGGCNGNLQGIMRLIKGMKCDDVIERLKGVSCNGGPTSCPDQLACALASRR